MLYLFQINQIGSDESFNKSDVLFIGKTVHQIRWPIVVDCLNLTGKTIVKQKKLAEYFLQKIQVSTFSEARLVSIDQIGVRKNAKVVLG
ncbi:hypothetical protein TYRP_009945 [Tyrophagus putrescentiae]|nr:hypothetical protein TYRP_009945 [Tyrophagus putrescentiae]